MLWGRQSRFDRLREGMIAIMLTQSVSKHKPVVPQLAQDDHGDVKRAEP
jgi:hypothetical protein